MTINAPPKGEGFGEILTKLNSISAELCALAYKEEVISDRLSELSHDVEDICDNFGKLMRIWRKKDEG